MSLESSLAQFRDTASIIRREFSGGMYDSLNQMFKDTGSLLSSTSGFISGMRTQADECRKFLKEIMPKGVGGIDEEMRNLEREIGWEGPGVFSSDAPSSHAAVRSPSSSGTFHPPKTSVYSGMKDADVGGKTVVTDMSSLGSSGAKREDVSSYSHARSYPKTHLSIGATGMSYTPMLSTSTSSLSKQYANWQVDFRRMFTAMNTCGRILGTSKRVLEALDSFARVQSALNALLGSRFDVDECNIHISNLNNIHTVATSLISNVNDANKGACDFRESLGAVQMAIDGGKNKLLFVIGRLKRKPRWIKNRQERLEKLASEVGATIIEVNGNIKRFKECIRRLKSILELSSQRINILKSAKSAEEERKQKIETFLQACNRYLCDAKREHERIVVSTKLSFSLNMSSGRYLGTTSKNEVLKEVGSVFGVSLKELLEASKQLSSVQKPPEELTIADINDTDVYPTFIVADSCQFSGGEGRCFTLPIPTAFPLSKSRRFANVSELSPFLLRLLCALPVGALHITIIDHAAMGSNGRIFNGLMCDWGVFRLVTQIDELYSALREHTDYMAALTRTGKFGATDRNWKEYNEHHPKKPLPCKVIVIYSFKGWDRNDINELEKLVLGGADSGVYVFYAKDGIEDLDERSRAKIEAWGVADTPVDAAKWAKDGAALSLKHIPMRLPDVTVVDQICRSYIRCLDSHASKPVHEFRDLFSHVPIWEASSADSIETVIGWDDADNPAIFRLGIDNQHALIGGKTGGGKSNLIHVILCSLCHKYSPEELQICLLDMKDGVEAFRYVDRTSQKTWLPHARAILASDSPHFASAFLTAFIEEMHARNELFRRAGTVNISEWRRKTGKKMPRILVIADEFTRIFSDSDYAKESSKKLFDLLSLGRNCGVHVLLATQNTDSLTTSNASAILSQTSLRLALPKAPGVLAYGNSDDDTLVKPQCILNEFSGASGKNHVFVHPYFNNVSKSPTDVESFRNAMAMESSKRGIVSPPMCKIVDGVSLEMVPGVSEFRARLGAESVGVRPKLNLLLGRTDDFETKPFIIQLLGDVSKDHLLIAAPKDPEKRQGVWNGLKQSILQSLALQKSKQVLFYNPLLERPFKLPAGFEVLGNEIDEAGLKLKLEQLRSSTARNKVLIVENFESAEFLASADNPFASPDDDGDTASGVFHSAFKRGSKAFTVILFTRDPVGAEELLGMSYWGAMGHHIAFGFENSQALRNVIKGTELLDNLGNSIFYSSPATGGGFRTILPFIRK